ncbi:MAG: ATP-binding domain-containing protein, partial [Candidatus Eisenbacteria bacterium]
EVSMVDILLMASLLEALPPGCRLVLVGDVDQLPSVGPGNVLRDLIESERVRTVRLTQIYRQARESRIVVNAHRVNRGQMPLEGEDAADFRFIEVEGGEQALDWIKGFLTGEVRERYGMDPLRDVQVMAPMHKGLAGVANLNRELQALLNPRGTEVRREGKVLRRGDKVIQLRNNYELDVFNGDVGRITDLDPEEDRVEVIYGPRRVLYGFSQLDEVTLAYAVSVHKSQGSEYRGVIVPLLGEHYPMLQRNLLYTAITRGRELVVLLGSNRTVGAAVRNNRIRQRYSFLAERLRRFVPEAP